MSNAARSVDQKKEFHGMYHFHEYSSWEAMIQRCTNPNSTAYPKYGGRGITICARWRHSFKNFIEDLGRKPSPVHSLERINNSRGYFKWNVRWATPKEQRANQKSYAVRSDAKSGRKGVQWHSESKKWRVRLCGFGIDISAGLYDCLEDAEIAYDFLALMIYGEKAYLNGGHHGG